MLDVLRTDLAVWRRIRASAPKPAEIGAAARARAAGDWRSAAAAAHADLEIDLDAVRDRFGREGTERLLDDLHHLSLDLLRWHLPRHRGGLTTLRARVSAILAPPAGAGDAPLLRIEHPIAPYGPQRLRVTVVAAPDLEYLNWFFAPRHTWDVRASAGLRAAWGGSADRMPLLTPDGRPLSAALIGAGDDPAASTERLYRQLAGGDIAGAWRAAGIELAFDPATRSDWNPRGRNGPPDDPPGMPACPVGVPAAVREAARAFGTDVVHTFHAAHLSVELADPPRATRDHVGDYTEIAARIAVDRVPADLALLHRGRLNVDDLHPLVAAALFRAPGDRPARTAAPPAHPPADPPAAPPADPPVGVASRVRCRGAWHTVAVSGGRLVLRDHDDDELRREQVVAALGGTPAGCFGVRADWAAEGRRLPRALRDHRREVVRRALDGDTDWVLDGIAAGTVDPRIRDGHGWTLMHMAMWMDFDRLLPVLLDHGLPIDAPDRIGRTPLYVTVKFGGSARLVRWFLDAGADVNASTVHDSGVLTALYRSDRTDLPFLSRISTAG